jgi:UDP-N-acetylmuramoyl-tripeptide--D-alanyl-D-alanine ligase
MITTNDLRQLPLTAFQHLEKFAMKNLTGISIDSRKTGSGDLFFAIKGERHDAHLFLKDVIANGVGACCVETAWFYENKNAFPDMSFVVVEDTTKALGLLANIYRKKFEIPFVAVAGSNGKTTTKEMLGAALSQKFAVLKTEGNLNNHIGVPLTLFKLTGSHEVAVVEIGTNHFGEIAYLCDILEPDICVMTNIGREHLEFFKDIEGVAKAEAELFQYIERAGKFACINGDDSLIVKTSAGIQTKITYGFSSEYDVHANYLGLDAMACPGFTINYKNEQSTINLQVPGEHAVSNAVAAAAVSLKLGVPLEQIKVGLENYQAFSKRMEVLKMEGITVINDCYNANPDSMLAALKTLSQILTSGKRIAVLGDMAELGDQSKEAHAEMGAVIGKMGIDFLFTIGADIALTCQAAKDAVNARHYSSKEALSKDLKSLLTKEDVLLVKGSRSMKLEEVIEQVFQSH